MRANGVWPDAYGPPLRKLSGPLPLSKLSSDAGAGLARLTVEKALSARQTTPQPLGLRQWGAQPLGLRWRVTERAAVAISSRAAEATSAAAVSNSDQLSSLASPLRICSLAMKTSRNVPRSMPQRKARRMKKMIGVVHNDTKRGASTSCVRVHCWALHDASRAWRSAVA